MTATTDHKPSSRRTVRHPAPPALADVALIDGPSIAAAACMSLSSFHELVKASAEAQDGEVPQPVIRQPRCTRWRMADIRQWLIKRAETGADPQAAAKVAATATKASAAAKARRTATVAVR